jgi:FkbM family methyltransferase
MPLYKFGHRLLSGRGLAAFYPVRVLDNVVLRVARPNTVDVLGHRMLLDRLDSLRLSVNGVHEPMETRFVQEHVTHGMTVVDLGANIGYYTLLFAHLVGEQGRVYAFEPDPESFAILQRNVALNGYKNIVTVNRAVSDRAGTVRLYLSPQNRGDHRIYDSQDRRATVDVGTVTLDEYFAQQPTRVDLIKMDIQGAEGLALRGMGHLLKRLDHSTLITEFWPGGLQRSGVSPSSYLAALRGHGFLLQEVNEREGWIMPTTPVDLLARYPAAKDGYTNLVCTRGQ